MKTGLNILLVIKSEVFREGLVRRLESKTNVKIISVCNTGSEAIKIAKQYVPDVVIIDVDFPECGSVEIIEHINQAVPKTSIIALSHAESTSQFLSAIRAGATGYISKANEFENMVDVINTVAGGAFSVSGAIANKVINFLGYAYESREATVKTEVGFLTKREKTIIYIAMIGASNKDIAEKLCISQNTVKVHMRNIMQKLHAHTRQEAIIFCIDNALLPVQD